MRLGAALVALIALMSSAAQAGGDGDCRRVPVYSARCFGYRHPQPGCRAIPESAVPCFTVHGMLTPSNGTPAIRIARMGNGRVLGVVGGEGDPESPTLLPKSVRAAMLPPTAGSLLAIVGDFRVCPLASERAGWMRPVCLVSGGHVRLSTWQPMWPDGRLPPGAGRVRVPD